MFNKYIVEISSHSDEIVVTVNAVGRYSMTIRFRNNEKKEVCE